MGGTINIAIRFKSGEAICQSRWTNTFPFWFRNPKMYEGDEDHVRAYLAMTRNNDYIADPYAPGRPEPLRNNSYGLIVWDYMTNHLLDNNGYSSPYDMDLIYFRTQREEWDTLAHSGRFKFRVRTAKKNQKGYSQFMSGPLKYENAVHLAELGRETESDKRSSKEMIYFLPDGSPAIRKLEADDEFAWYDFVIDTSPMTVCKFPEHEFKDYKAKLIELGFPMNKKQGLNATAPKIRTRKGVVSDDEILARELYQNWQVSEQGKDFEGKNYDGILFDDVPKFIQKQFRDHAVAVRADPKKLQEHTLGRLFGV